MKILLKMFAACSSMIQEKREKSKEAFHTCGWIPYLRQGSALAGRSYYKVQMVLLPFVAFSF